MSTTASEKVDVPSRRATRERLYEDLARRFYAGVYNYLCWTSRDPALAEDLTQETFMCAWRSIGELRSRRAARVWIYRVARNQFLQHRRRSEVETVPLDDPTAADVASGALDSQAHLERTALREAVKRALRSLNEEQREVIILGNLEGLSLAQVAQVLDVPIGTVKSRRARAFAALRRLLAEVRSDEV